MRTPHAKGITRQAATYSAALATASVIRSLPHLLRPLRTLSTQLHTIGYSSRAFLSARPNARAVCAFDRPLSRSRLRTHGLSPFRSWPPRTVFQRLAEWCITIHSLLECGGLAPLWI